MVGMNRSTMALAMAAALCGSAGMARADIIYSLATPETNVANWPYSAAVNTVRTVADLDPSGKYVDLGRSNNSTNRLRMAQTFQVANTFTIDSISLLVWNVAPANNIHFRIFSVADITSSLNYPLNPSNVLVSGTFVYGGATTLGGRNILTIDLTGADQAAMAATSNGAGYAFELYVDSVTPAGVIQWEATVNDTVAGLPLTYNTSGTSGVYNTSRDYSLAITAATVPEPLSLAMLAGLGFAALLTRKRG